jgi:hypothetical protein
MKVIFDLAAGRLAIEGDGPELLKVLQVARDLAPNVSQIQIITTGANLQLPDQATSTQPSANSRNEQKQGQSTVPATLRQFARSLAVSNASERIAAIAYYANKIEGRQSFSPKEIDGWFTMCGFQKPSQMGVALFDAKRKYGYLDNFGRGMWRISTQGENLILGKLDEGNSS